MKTFPNVSYAEFSQIDDIELRSEIVSANRIIQTDTYNRTMAHTNGDLGKREGEFTMTFRKAPLEKLGYPFIVIHGIRSIVKRLLESPITTAELEFAKAYYADQKARGGNGMFSPEIWESVVNEHGGFLPLDVRTVADGTIVQAGDPILAVKGPTELASVFEPDYLMSFYDSSVATMAAAVALEIGADRMIDMGLRSTLSIQASLRANEALYVGGGIGMTSNDAAGAVYPWLKNAGTLAHRYMAMYPTQRDAFVQAIESNARIALLVDLVNSSEGIRIGMELKREYAPLGKSIQFRLDSGDLAAQAIKILTLQAEAGMVDPAQDYVIVSDISSIEKVRALESTVQAAGFDPKVWLRYGAGGMLVSRDKTRDAISGCFKITEFDGHAVGKLSDDAGKISIPGSLDIEIGADGSRTIVQSDEPVAGTRLLETYYSHGKFNGPSPRSLSSVQAARERVRIALEAKTWQTPSILSEKTETVKAKVVSYLRNEYVR